MGRAITTRRRSTRRRSQATAHRGAAPAASRHGGAEGRTRVRPARPEPVEGRASTSSARTDRTSAAAPQVQLAYALDRDGARAFVGDLDPKRRRDRAPFRCIGCGDELLPHLGEKRARHFAHRPGSTCALTSPETALHLNAKERLLELCALAFAHERRVSLLVRCPACRRETPVDLGQAGDGADAEGAAGKRRCDVLVTLAGAPALALEVKVSHAVDAAKASALARAGIPAVEIDAHEAWEREDEDGVAVVPSRSLGFGRCGACETSRRADQDRALGGDEAERAELESYRARGLLGPRPGPPLPSSPDFSAGDAATLRFRCPECGGSGLSVSGALARHACAGAAARPVAWRGYDGALVQLAWWRR